MATVRDRDVNCFTPIKAGIDTVVLPIFLYKNCITVLIFIFIYPLWKLCYLNDTFFSGKRKYCNTIFY